MLCGRELDFINPTHLKTHGITVKEYKEMFPDAPLTSRELRKKRSEFLRQNNPMKDPEIRKKWDSIMHSDKNPAKRPEVRKKISEKMKGRKCPWIVEFNKRPEVRKTRGKHMKLEKYRKLISELLKGKPRPWTSRPDVREKISRKMKERWKDPEYREKVLRALFESCKLRPTKPERKFIEINEKYQLGFRYVGDGKLWIGYPSKNPDFVHKDLRVVIEIAGRYWHTDDELEERVKHFQKYGFKCIYFWEDELENEEYIVRRVREVLDYVKKSCGSVLIGN